MSPSIVSKKVPIWRTEFIHKRNSSHINGYHPYASEANPQTLSKWKKPSGPANLPQNLRGRVMQMHVVIGMRVRIILHAADVPSYNSPLDASQPWHMSQPCVVQILHELVVCKPRKINCAVEPLIHAPPSNLGRETVDQTGLEEERIQSVTRRSETRQRWNLFEIFECIACFIL